MVRDEDIVGDAASVARCDVEITGDEGAGARGNKSACSTVEPDIWSTLDVCRRVTTDESSVVTEVAIPE